MIFNKPFHSASLLRFSAWTEIANLSRMLMELFTVLVWYSVLTHSIPEWPLNLLVLGLIFFFSYFTARYLNKTSLKPVFQRTFFFGWIFLMLFISLKTLLFRSESISFLNSFLKAINLLSDEYNLDSFWHLSITLILILRSVLITRYPISTGDALSSFRNCLIFFILHAFVFSKQMPELTVIFFFCYLFSGLICLSTARIADLGDLQGGRLPSFNRNWAAGIFSASLLGLLASFLLGLFLNLRVAEFISKMLVTIVQLVSGLIVLLFSPILFGFLYVLEFLVKLLGPLLNQTAEVQEMELGYDALDVFGDQVEQVSNFDPRALILGSILLGLIIIAVISLRRKPWKRTFQGEIEISSTTPEKKQHNHLQNLLENLGDLFRSGKANRFLAAAQIRRIYAGLMDLSKKLGHERPGAITPLEFLPQLEKIFPQYPEELRTITFAYMQIRYGEIPEKMEEVERVKIAWESIKEYGNQELENRKKALKNK